MTLGLIYLDNAATTPMHPAVVEAMQPLWTETFGNPASLHAAGRFAKKAWNAAMASLMESLGIANEEDMILTSGGTETDNLAIIGISQGLAQRGKHIITTAIEHPAVLEPCEALARQGWEVTYLPVNREGLVDPKQLTAAIRPDTVLISIMHGNNEVGSIQDLTALGQIARQHGILFHTDAVQTVGKLAIDCKALPIDLLSISAHKLRGPKGVGLLYANEAARKVLQPQLLGGGQQNGLRSGTLNVAGAVGLSTALSLCLKEKEQTNERLFNLMQRLQTGIQAIAPNVCLNGPQDLRQRLPGNLNYSFVPVEGETLVLRLDRAGVAVSSGSACHSGGLNPSHVVMALHQDEALARSTVRFSMGGQTTQTEIEQVLAVLPGVLEKCGYSQPSRAAATIA